MAMPKKITLSDVLSQIPAGCSTNIKRPKGDTPRGFVWHSGYVAYVMVVDSTSRPHVSGDIMYREARSTTDYSGTRNQYCSVEELRGGLSRLLHMTGE